MSRRLVLTTSSSVQSEPKIPETPTRRLVITQTNNISSRGYYQWIFASEELYKLVNVTYPATLN